MVYSLLLSPELTGITEVSLFFPSLIHEGVGNVKTSRSVAWSNEGKEAYRVGQEKETRRKKSVINPVGHRYARHVGKPVLAYVRSCVLISYE